LGFRIAESKDKSARSVAQGKAHGVKINCLHKNQLIKKEGARDVYTTKKGIKTKGVSRKAIPDRGSMAAFAGTLLAKDTLLRPRILALQSNQVQG